MQQSLRLAGGAAGWNALWTWGVTQHRSEGATFFLLVITGNNTTQISADWGSPHLVGFQARSVRRAFHIVWFCVTTLSRCLFLQVQGSFCFSLAVLNSVWKQREQERQSRQGRIEGYPLTGFPPFPSRIEGLRTSERVGESVNHATCPRAHTNLFTCAPKIKHEHRYERACCLCARTVCCWETSSLFLCMVAETLRLALCGPDYSRISAVTYYTSLWTISETARQPGL